MTSPTTRTLLLLAVLATASASAQEGPAQEGPAQGRRPVGSTLVLAGPGAIEGAQSLGLGYHAGLRQRLVSVEELPGRLRSFGSVGLSAEASCQYGLASDGRPWLLGAALASRWDPAPETWAVRPYFVPVAVGLYVDGGAYAGETSLALGTGTGFGVEVPVGSVALAVEARSVNLLDSDGGSIPVSVGLRF